MPEFTLFVHNDMVNQSNILIVKLYNYILYNSFWLS